MAAPALSYLICTVALVSLIFMMPFFYSYVTNNIQKDVAQRELKEIADYVSNTFANSYFLVNSKDYLNVSLTKELKYLPSTVEDSFYIVKIEGNGSDASKITTYLTDRPSISAEAWLSAGLKKGSQNFVESGLRKVVAGCSRDGTGIYVWIDYG